MIAGDAVAIAVDTCAVWCNPQVLESIGRAGRRIVSFHVSDRLADTQDLRFDRGTIRRRRNRPPAARVGRRTRRM